MSETTQFGFSYEYAVDIKTGEDTWQPIRFISAVNPQVTPKEIDAATYDDNGADHPVKVGETAQLDFYVQMHRLDTGKFLPEVEALLGATHPDASGSKASVTVRYYDAPAGEQKANPDEAFELVGTVSMTRAETGNDAIAGWNFTIKGQGARKKITNPKTAGLGG